jgi:hypothetical protein
MVKRLARRALNAIVERYGYVLAERNLPRDTAIYDQDGMRTVHNHDFMRDPVFIRAYQRGVDAGKGVDNLLHWRIHVALWAADHASRLAGDFVECGVNKGAISSSVLAYLDWKNLGKRFFLLDTFGGMDERFVTEEEKRLGKLELNRRVLAANGYELNPESVRRNFSEWERIHVVQGPVPETLPLVDTASICYLHLDMNCAVPERAALEYFWPRLVPGGMVLFDDYAYVGFETQKATHDEFARAHGVSILSLPTGQGLLVKPQPR